MIQVTICPGKPYDLVSFLQPVIAEVNQLYNRGLVVKKSGQEVFRGNVAILGFTGDIPGISELMDFSGHTSTYGCRVCTVKADNSTVVTPHGKYFSSEANQRTVESLIDGDLVSFSFSLAL